MLNKLLAAVLLCAVYSNSVSAGNGKIVAVPNGNEIPPGAVPMPSG
jgi:hypothetical protein